MGENNENGRYLFIRNVDVVEDVKVKRKAMRRWVGSEGIGLRVWCVEWVLEIGRM